MGVEKSNTFQKRAQKGQETHCWIYKFAIIEGAVSIDYPSQERNIQTNLTRASDILCWDYISYIS